MIIVSTKFMIMIIIILYIIIIINSLLNIFILLYFSYMW